MNAPVFNYKSQQWKQARASAMRRAMYRCEWCGRSVAGLHKGRVDHRITVRDNPRLAFEPANLRVLCVLCDAARHAEKGARNVPRQTIGLDGYPLP